MPTPATQHLTDKVILGIDPGTNMLGYGVLHVRSRRDVAMEAMGVIDLRKVGDTYLKLGRIYERVMGIIDSFHPDEMAIEAPFFGKNIQSMLKLGRAQGVAIAAAMSRDIPIHEYAPMKIKLAITGTGAASKEQVAEMLKRMLRLRDEQMLPYLDATDALAAAYCHHIQSGRETPGSTGPHTWAAYVRQHQGRAGGVPTAPQQKLLDMLKQKKQP
ncbi:MAG: crossover junction endodeoxyribonuclease RuvC [Alloprevotella sp.]|nr:crossover junction endodeoxyribonuclease RuvC [Alloprevotella sp.]